ncbi:hypothetical protein CPB84DRAFT_1799311 [Gymnopilus junonius]|uniref:Uncharacterized protein n=1 Tax=Gymnopilus junonius TaxID=109634 RepID=A0A9P5N8K8_GYMJU|nr:hypothetical protein CPB84DRAFT_1799311 [Gymnopilus junonius]
MRSHINQHGPISHSIYPCINIIPSYLTTYNPAFSIYHTLSSDALRGLLKCSRTSIHQVFALRSRVSLFGNDVT